MGRPAGNSFTPLSLRHESEFPDALIGGNSLDMESMGRTVPSFRMALEGEIASWREFGRSLRTIGSREDLDTIFDQARTNCMAAGNAIRPVVFEGMFMAVAFSHERRLTNIGRAIEKLRMEMSPQKESEQAQIEPNV